MNNIIEKGYNFITEQTPPLKVQVLALTIYRYTYNHEYPASQIRRVTYIWFDT